MNIYDIIKTPCLSEKTFALIEKKRYVFKVDKNATKSDIKRAIEEIFGVEVLRVNTVNYDGKLKRMGRTEGRRSSFKKAYVILKETSKPIEFFESLA